MSLGKLIFLKFVEEEEVRDEELRSSEPDDERSLPWRHSSTKRRECTTLNKKYISKRPQYNERVALEGNETVRRARHTNKTTRKIEQKQCKKSNYSSIKK